MTKLGQVPRKALIALHVAVAVSLLGTDLVLLLLTLSGWAGADPRTVYPAARLVGEWLVEPLAATALVTGLLVAITGPYGLFQYWWTTIKLAITAGLTAAVFLALTPALEAAAEASLAPAAARQPLTLLLAPAIASALLVVNVVLAVFKPAARLSRPAIPSTKSKEITT